MHTALCGVDVVGEGADALRDVVDVLECDLNIHAVQLFFDVKNMLVNGRLVTVLERDK